MSVHDYLNSFTNFESKLNTVSSKEFGLGRVEELLSFLDNPQKDLKVIHVAGTKGKGSTCAFISYILANAGFKVGLYTSPHLHRLNERIRILDKGVMASLDDFYGMISDDQLNQIIHIIRPHIAALSNRGLELTYFEVMTVIALMFYRQQKVDYVILETGLGGRLDATNVVLSDVAVITPISLDHMHILGDTIEAIAEEKAGIIKNSHQAVVIAPQEPEALKVILARCQEYGITPVVVDGEIAVHQEFLLKGAHQRVNASVAAHAIEALKVFGSPAYPGLIHQAIAVTRWAGRFEVLNQDPLVIADGAHNAASMRALARTVKDYYPKHHVMMILGMSTDKDITAVAQEIKHMADTVIVTKADHPRAHVFNRREAEELFAPKTWFMTQSISEAIELAISKTSKDHVILITGSLFIVATARKQAYVPIQKS